MVVEESIRRSTSNTSNNNNNNNQRRKYRADRMQCNRCDAKMLIINNGSNHVMIILCPVCLGKDDKTNEL